MLAQNQEKLIDDGLKMLNKQNELFQEIKSIIRDNILKISQKYGGFAHTNDIFKSINWLRNLDGMKCKNRYINDVDIYALYLDTLYYDITFKYHITLANNTLYFSNSQYIKEYAYNYIVYKIGIENYIKIDIEHNLINDCINDN